VVVVRCGVAAWESERARVTHLPRRWLSKRVFHTPDCMPRNASDIHDACASMTHCRICERAAACEWDPPGPAATTQRPAGAATTAGPAGGKHRVGLLLFLSWSHVHFAAVFAFV
jgi:hypothetical protein